MSAEDAPRLFCSHGATLFYIARHPRCTTRDLASALFVTTRTVWTLISALKRAGLIEVYKKGRRHHYVINARAPFPDPVLRHLAIGDVFEALTN